MFPDILAQIVMKHLLEIVNHMSTSVKEQLSSSPTIVSHETVAWKGAKLIPSLTILTFACALWWLPSPTGLDIKAWHLFIIFTSTIVGIVSKILPMGALSLIAIAVGIGTHTLTIQQSLSSYNSNIIWLILFAFLIARGFMKTGLGTRIAYKFTSVIGKSSLGLAYGMIVTDFLLAPFIPSNTARSGGILFPIVTALSNEYGSEPNKPSRTKLGAYLMQVTFQGCLITCAMFLTAMASNPLLTELAAKIGVQITWTTWALATIVPGTVNLMLLPLAMYWLYPPEIKHTPEAPAMARQKLKEMGPLRTDELIMLGTFSLLLFLWIFGHNFGIHATTAALFGLVILLFTGILTWKDVLSEHVGWDTFIWMGSLLMMANFLGEYGMMGWLSQHMQSLVTGFHWIPAVLTLGFLYFYSHYLFPSMTAHITALYTGTALVAISLGAPALLVCMVFAILSNLCGGITHYGTGPAVVYFGSGYITMKEWWTIGGLISIFNLLVWGIVGSIWWGIIGLW